MLFVELRRILQLRAFLEINCSFGVVSNSEISVKGLSNDPYKLMHWCSIKTVSDFRGLKNAMLQGLINIYVLKKNSILLLKTSKNAVQMSNQFMKEYS